MVVSHRLAACARPLDAKRMTNGVSRSDRNLRHAVGRACVLLKEAEAGATGRKELTIERAIDVLQRALDLDQPTELRALQELERQRDGLEKELVDVRAELRQRDDFLAVVAHELRNPITPLSFAVDSLLTEVEQGRPPSGDVLLRRLRILQRQIRRLMNDLNRLLDLTRIRSGRLDLRLEEVDLAQIVAEVLTEMKPQFDRHQCDLRLSSAGPQKGFWDSMRLRHIVWNLISNATKFGAGAPVEVDVSGDEHFARLSVRDHGPGIATEERKRVFERFERATAGRLQTGFGIGLWLVERIVAALDGKIGLESEPGQGARFIVTLPRTQHG
jgi:signal transduction histidine kinase